MLGIALALTVLVQRRSLQAFFTPDDLVTLEMAAGIHPFRFTIWRLVSENLYFRMMLAQFGVAPVPYHIVNLALHLANVFGVFWLARRLALGPWAAFLAATIFGALPLFVTPLSQAVSVNDILACSLILLAARLLFAEENLPVFLVPLLVAAAILSKEVVVFLPCVFWWVNGDDTHAHKRVVPSVVLALAFVPLFFVLRSRGLAPAGPYEVHMGTNVFHSLMTYLVWGTDLGSAIPDLTRSYNPVAWHRGIWIAAAFTLVAFQRSSESRALRVGVGWLLLSLLPVLGLRYLAYSPYLYVPMVGLAIALASCVAQVQSIIVAHAPALRRWPYLLPLAACLLAVSYAARADYVIGRRLGAQIPNSGGLPLDPSVRKMELAHRSLGSLGQSLSSTQRKLLILSPLEAVSVFGARTGNRYDTLRAGQRPYNLMEAVLDSGRAVRLFYPWVDSVAFEPSWDPRYSRFALFLPTGGYLRGFGTGPMAQASAIAALLSNGFDKTAVEHGRRVLMTYPDDPYIRLAYAGALFRNGSPDEAFAELRAARAVTTDSTLLVEIDQALALHREARPDRSRP